MRKKWLKWRCVKLSPLNSVSPCSRPHSIMIRAGAWHNASHLIYRTIRPITKSSKRANRLWRWRRTICRREWRARAILRLRTRRRLEPCETIWSPSCNKLVKLLKLMWCKAGEVILKSIANRRVLHFPWHMSAFITVLINSLSARARLEQLLRPKTIWTSGDETNL